MKDDVKKWMEKDGRDFFTSIGIKKGWFVLDFGSGYGYYAIAASKAVGRSGKVYALDKDKDKLERLRGEIKQANIENIRIINENSKIPLENESVNAALCYDVIHYEDKKRRVAIYNEIHRVLKKRGLFSVYPKHYKKDRPLDELADMDLADVTKEIEESEFVLEDKYWKVLLHDEYYNPGDILNFKKK
jgi:ubiquinone/menaquinone biosynthesis C-methylase UbiE